MPSFASSFLILCAPLLLHLRKWPPYRLFATAALAYAAVGLLDYMSHINAPQSTQAADPLARVSVAASSAILMAALAAIFMVQHRQRGAFATGWLTTLFWALHLSALIAGTRVEVLARVLHATVDQGSLLQALTVSFVAAQVAWLCLIGLLVHLALSALTYRTGT